jgi:hypothetical protein
MAARAATAYAPTASTASATVTTYGERTAFRIDLRPADLLLDTSPARVRLNLKE